MSYFAVLFLRETRFFATVLACLLEVNWWHKRRSVAIKT